jgi:uncharacterized membrane protein
MAMAPSGVSANGAVVVGGGTDYVGHSEAAFWTAGSGVQRLGDIGASFPYKSFALAVSGDGTTLVGYGNTPWNGNQAARSPVGQPLQSLYGQPATGYQSRATAVSADGSVVVGFEGTVNGNIAYRWTAETGRQFLGAPVGASYEFSATGVSADGLVVVGRRDTISPPTGLPYRWTSSSGLVPLPDLPGGEVLAEARGVSADGSTVVGAGNNNFGRQAAARWDSAGNVFALGAISGTTEQNSIAFAVSGNGTIIVGQAVLNGNNGSVGLVWDAPHGSRSAASFLTDNGVSFAGWQLTSVSGISADGTTLVGMGIDPSGQTEGWVAVVPTPASIMVLGGAAVVLGRRKRAV